ncbi:pyruvate ferredoxin oxidoreductase subunit gamma [Candidatus Kuenenbacteria bacterium]|nr:pyruvate ferredoxin oxidoreductase subunit gamma [Candidatus Kuenenbacteria bacterium]
MIQVRLHGRGGQGTVTAAELIAVAAFYDGKYSQAFPNFGVERRGAPVMAFARISDHTIRLREQIYEPDYIIVQDPSLVKVEPTVLAGINNSLGILINTEIKEWPQIKCKKIVTVPATKIAMEKIGKPFINTAVIGAFAGMSGLLSIDSIKRAITERFPEKVAVANIAAMEEAFNFTKK